MSEIINFCLFLYNFKKVNKNGSNISILQWMNKSKEK
jgi:hypothetical protein